MSDDGLPLPATERIELTSAGLDVGSATCQLSLSRLVMVREGTRLASSYAVESANPLHTAQLGFTPYAEDGSIDAGATARMFADAVAASGVATAEIDTGIVLLTGEAALRRNARALADRLGAATGQLVCAAAGHAMEGRLAAHGAGVDHRARALGATVLSVDIGGGTTKITAMTPDGMRSTFAVHVGGRLAAFDSGQRIVRLEEAGARLAEEAGFRWRRGQIAGEAEVAAVADHMAQVVAAFLPGGSRADRHRFAHHLLTESAPVDDAVSVVVSGGVAAFVAREEREWREDLGARLGSSLRARLDQLPISLEVAMHEATVLGASRQTAQLSGNTVHVDDQARLPLRNLRVVELGAISAGPTGARAASLVAEDAAAAQRVGSVAFLASWRGPLSASGLDAAAAVVADAVEEHLPGGQSAVVVVDTDIAGILGPRVAARLAGRNPLALVDGLRVGPDDFLDVGAIREESGVLPVTIRSMFF